MDADGVTRADGRLWFVGSSELIDGLVAITRESDRCVVDRFPTADAVKDRGAVESNPVDGIVIDSASLPTDERQFLDQLPSTETGPPVIILSSDDSQSVQTRTEDPDLPPIIELPGDNSWAAVGSTIDGLVSWHRRIRGIRDQARRFEALYADSDTFLWILDSSGKPIDRNRGAEATGWIQGSGPLWDTIRWTTKDDDSTELRSAIESALGGEISRIGGRIEGPTDESRHVELTCYPVKDGHRSGQEVLILGRDVTERAELEQELRASERLHRITLNNMTDTVLVTDDDGRFTYICPNVHFIFGYSDEEVRQLGTIDDLLEAELFDRTELTEQGVLTNRECTVTDKHGEEHHLLVNVREVDIQDGTTLYSCRDVTTRKRREESLTALHQTAQTLLYEESAAGIGERIVKDASDVLDLPLSALYVFDTETSLLRPQAVSEQLSSSDPSLPEIEATGRSVIGRVFVEGESRFLTDGTSQALTTHLSELTTAAFVPLGDHGVFVAGTDSSGQQFSAVSRELTELLAATAEAALDRVERERTLREQEQELQDQNRRLSRLNQVNEIIRTIDRAIVEAESRDEIEREVCDRLTMARFDFAWIGEPDSSDGSLQPRAWAGNHGGYLDSVDLAYQPPGPEPASATAAAQSVTMVENVAEGFREDPWRTEALQRGFQSVISVPLAYDDFLYGVLTVYAGDRADPEAGTQAVLEELGKTVASAISSVERKNALLAAKGTEVEYEITDPSFPLLRLSAIVGAAIHTEGPIQQSNDGVYLYVSVEGPDLEDFRSAATDLTSVIGFEVIRDTEDELVLRLEFTRPFIALSLVDHGVTLRSVTITDGAARLLLDVPEGIRFQTVHQILTNAFDEPEILSKRQVDRTESGIDATGFLEALTARQLEVVQTAHKAGYFESPRASSGKEVAAKLGISAPGFYNHIRAVERKLFTRIVEASGD